MSAPGFAQAAVPASTVRDGGSQPIYSFTNAIRETVWVDTGIDGDGDGHTDRVAADIIRPREPAQAGQKIPVIMDASPYYSCCGRGNESQVKTYDAQGRPVGFPLYYDNYFVPRGYAVVLVDLTGTNKSQGCVDVGGRSDIASARAVVDWLNGRAGGYTASSGGSAVRPDWTNGSVGMIGKSYDGTIADGVAATGVAGLRTIVPISAISSWYDYYRSDGASFGSNPDGLARTVESSAASSRCAAVHRRLVSGAAPNGDFTSLWTERDYVLSAGKVRASVFAVHGLGDLNVKTINLGQWWDALAAHNVPRKLWLSQTGHVDPFDYRRAQWVDTLHRWFDHTLLGMDNGIDREPMVDVERHPDAWTTDPVWPPSGTANTVLRPVNGQTPGLGQLGTATPPSGSTATFTDDPQLGEQDWAAQPDSASSARLLYDTGPLAADLRLSGTGTVTVTATPSTSAARLSAVLVDYGPTTIRDYLGNGEGINTLSTKSCWGADRPGDSSCYYDTQTATTDVDLEVFSRGWADLGHYASLASGRTLTPGRAYTMTFRLSTVDHVVPQGHHLALVLAGTDGGEITAPSHPPTITLGLGGTSASLPVVGGAAAVRPEPGVHSAPAVRPDHLPRTTAPVGRLG
ncbi:Xaa-Pro dipeptidyl-peptidase [Solihabitans fulvus]|uniref:Xaa-Pro dipeptidyl-peptidase n=1 Tax=Solihabitans fulvus TaxID=1892852 RepID=UPI001CB76715|nr:Xaa-Pro dipeptidyl-peptidase [Solihabitans fulvus]